MVFHISRGSSMPLKDVLGGGEAQVMTPAIAKHISVLDSTLSCWFDPESPETEVALFGRSLDVLATAEIPGTGEEISVAIENQYGQADPDHFGRLVGWYMPEVGADMGVLIAESFEPHLVRAVGEGQIIQPRHGLWLVEAAGFDVGGAKTVSYSLKATSLNRDRLLARELAFKKNQSGGGSSGDEKAAADSERTEAIYNHIIRTGPGELSQSLSHEKTVGRWYRHLEVGSKGNIVAIFIGQNRIAIGSGYRKGQLSTDTLDQLTTLNNSIELEPSPFKRELRTIWWKIADVGRSTPPDQLPETLGVQAQKSYDEVIPAVREHQAKILEVLDRL